MPWGSSEGHIKFRIPVFDGGLNTRFVDTNTPTSQSPDCQNVGFDDRGGVSTVPGYTALVTAPGLRPIDGLIGNFSAGDDRQILVVNEERLWVASALTFASVPSCASIYTIGVDVCMIQVSDEVFITNGYVKPYKWDGVNFRQIGVSAPVGTAGVALTASAGALMNGSYRYALAGVNTALVEGDYDVISTYISATSNEGIMLSGIYVWPTSAGVDTKYLYRTTAGTSSLFYRVTSLSNAQTAYTDTAADSAIATVPQSDAEAPPYCKWFVYFNQRVFGSGNPTHPYRIFYSEYGAPETWASTNYFDVEEGDGAPITGISPLGTNLLIHKHDSSGSGSVYLLFQPDTADTSWEVIKSPAALGGESHKAQAFFNNMLLFLNRHGAYAFSNSDLALSVADSSVGKVMVDSHSYNIEPDIQSVNDSYISKMAAITFDNKVYVAIPYGSSTTKNNRVYLYDYVRASSDSRAIGAWSYQTGPYVNNFSTHEGELIAGSADDTGIVYKMNTGYAFSGAAIDSYFWTIPISGKEEHRDNTKTWRYAFVTVKASGNWDLNVNYRVDTQETEGTETTLSLAGGGSLWGTMIWGTSRWNRGQETLRKRIVLQNAVGKNIQFRFRTNTANYHFELLELELHYDLHRQRND